MTKAKQDQQDDQAIRTFEQYRARYFPSIVEKQAELAEAPFDFGSRLARETLVGPSA